MKELNIIKEKTGNIFDIGKQIDMDIEPANLCVGTKVICARETDGVLRYYFSKYRELFVHLYGKRFLSISDYANINTLLSRDYWTIEDYELFVNTKYTTAEVSLGESRPDFEGNFVFDPMRINGCGIRPKSFYELLTFMAKTNKIIVPEVNKEIKTKFCYRDTEDYMISGDMAFEEIYSIIDKPIRKRR